MAKEHVWHVSIGGKNHRVDCVLKGNKYVLYVDDEFLTNVYRKSFGPDDVEVPVTICGKRCSFIVWDQKPDLVVDGILLGRGIDHQQALTRRQKNHQMVYWIIFCFGVMILVFVAVFAILSNGKSLDYDTLLFYTIVGVLMIIYGHGKTRRLTLPKNSPIIGEENSEGADLE